MQGMSLLASSGLSKRIQDYEKKKLECRRIMDGICAPAVIDFMLNLAISRDRLQQLKDLLLMGLDIDVIRRLIMDKTYYPANVVRTLISPMRSASSANAVIDGLMMVSRTRRGWFGNIWGLLRLRLRSLFP